MSCTVCQEVFGLGEHGPRLLPCLHLTCAICVRDILMDAKEKARPSVCLACDCPFSAGEAVPLTPATVVVTTCAIHDKQDGSLFCEECKMLICEECKQDHGRHNVLPKESAHSKHKSDLESQVTRLSKCLPKIQQGLEQLIALQATLSNCLISLVNQIQSTFNSFVDELIDQNALEGTQYIESFEKRRDVLVGMVQELIKADLKTLEIQQQTLENSLGLIRVVQEHFETIQASTSMSILDTQRLIGIIIPQIRRLELVQCEPAVQTDVQFHCVRPADLLAVDISSLGVVRRPRDYSKIDNPVQTFYVTASGRRVNNPTGIGQLSNGDIVVADFNYNRICIFSRDGAEVSHFKVPCDPCHLYVSAKDQIWIAGPNTHKLLCYTRDGLLVRSLNCQAPFGIAVSANGNIVVAGGSTICVQCFTEHGDQVWSSPVLFNSLGVAVTSGGEVIVCDYDKPALVVLSLVDGRFIREIGVGQLHEPRGVAWIPHSDKIVVTEGLFASIWTLEGERVHRWGKFNDVYGVTVLADDALAFTDSGYSCVQVF